MLKEYQGVIACNVADFNPDQRKWLRGFVDQGGGLLICLGDKVQVDRVNAWEPVAEGGLRIGSLGARAPWEGSIKPTANAAFEFSKASLDSLGSARFVARNTLKLDEDQGIAPITTLAYDDGLPFLVSVALGSGRCFWMTSGCDDDDSNLPALPVFLPLVQRMMTTALRWPVGWEETELGENWVESFSQAKKLSLQVPGQTAREFQADPASLVSLGSSRLEGIGQAVADQERFYHGFTTTAADRKQELSRDLMAIEEQEALAKSSSATLHQDAKHWLEQEKTNSSGKELWTWFWLGLLAMFLAEMFLQQSLSPRSSGARMPTGMEQATGSTKRGAA
jgi:hypothetical protein